MSSWFPSLFIRHYSFVITHDYLFNNKQSLSLSYQVKNYLSTALRNLGRNKMYAAINILVWRWAFTCSLVIFLVLKFE
jgi:hypothetical protein